MADDDLTPQELEQLKDMLGISYPKGEEKVGIFHFFNEVLKTGDTSKVSNLDDKTELPSVRLLQSTALYSEEMGLTLVADYLRKEAEIVLATADSKKGFLIQQIVTQKKELKTKSGDTRGKKGWFKKKEEQD